MAAGRGVSIRWLLALLVVVAVTPVLVLAGVLLLRFSASESSRYEAQGLQIAQRTALALDRDVAAIDVALRALSTSRTIHMRDEAALAERVAVAEEATGTDISFAEGAAPSPAFMSDLTQTRDGWALLASVPVVREGRSIGRLVARVDPARLGRTLLPERVESGWTLSLVDRSGRIVWRSREPERFLGQLATEDLRRHARGREGVWHGTTLDGQAVLAAYARSDATGFRVAVGAAEAQVEEPLTRSLWMLAGFGLLALAVSLLLGLWVASRIARPLGRLAGGGEALARGEVTPDVPTRVREIAQLSGILGAASRDLQQRSAALSESRQRLAQLLDLLPMAVVETGRDGSWSYANPAAEQLLRLSRSEMVGRPYDAPAWGITDPEGGAVDPADLPSARALRGETVSGYEHAITDPATGERIILSVNSVPVLSDSGEVTGSIAALTDVTDRHRAEMRLQEVNESLEQAVEARTAELSAALARLRDEAAERRRAEDALRHSQKMEAIGQLTGSVAHDFNNLLTVIRSSAELLQRPEVKEERKKRYLDAIGQASDRAAALTAQLLSFARRRPLQASVFDLARSTGAMLDLLRTTLGAQIPLGFACDLEAAPVEADPNQYETAILNMVVNARDALGESGRVDISICDAADGRIAVAIRDTGRGIDADTMERVFEPFFTTKDVGKGTGLGLSQVYGFARQSGGEVTVESVVGEGTTFTLLLPRSAKPVDGEKPADAPRADGGQRRVLVVEDDALVADLAMQILEELGYAATLAPDAAVALGLLERTPDAFDIVFSDVVMPGEMSGVDLANRLKAERPDLPVVLATGYSHVIAEKGARGIELIQKPYSLETVAEVLERVLADKAGG